MALPDFIVVGAPHAGTSGLHAALACHPGLAMSRVAEPGFFLSPGQRPAEGGGRPDPGSAESIVWCRSDYEALFPIGDRRLRGECTPYYLAEFQAQRRMHEVLPYLRIIAVLRDPVERAYASWAAQRRAGHERLATLVEALDAEAPRKAAGWARRWRYAEHGHYGQQLRRLHTLFAPGQVLLLRYRDLVERPDVALREVCSFLRPVADPAAPVRGAGRIFAPVVADPRGNWVIQDPAAADPTSRMLAKLRRHLAPEAMLPPGLRACVLERFADDIALLGEVTRCSFDDWLDRGDRPLHTPH